MGARGGAAAALGEDRETLEDVFEPYLLQEGFIARTKRGREATERAYNHLNRHYVTRSPVTRSPVTRSPQGALFTKE
jgi:Holliday junction DNA helicase RuvB